MIRTVLGGEVAAVEIKVGSSASVKTKWPRQLVPHYGEVKKGCQLVEGSLRVEIKRRTWSSYPSEVTDPAAGIITPAFKKRMSSLSSLLNRTKRQHNAPSG